MLPSRVYPSKVILLGEYSVIQAAQAVAIPARQFSGRWQWAASDSQQYIRNLWSYMHELQIAGKLLFSFDAARMKAALAEDLFLESNIPIGYGLGSSGALCAAVYDSFALEKTTDWKQLKAIFAQLESHFHGASSGTDPLISYVNEAVHIADASIQACTIPKLEEERCFFLLNSGKARKSEPFIQWFVAQSKKVTYQTALKKVLVPAVDAAIASLLSEERSHLFQQFHTISEFQYQYFQPMVTDALRPLWKVGLESSYFKLKLCGAGGGGFFLGITNDWERLQASISDFDLEKLMV